MILQIFTDYFYASLSTNVIGLESAVALENAYALAVTLVIGLKEIEDGAGCQEAHNPQAALFGRAVVNIPWDQFTN